MKERNTEISYNICRHLGVIRDGVNGGWNRELNIVSWNGGKPKYDIRDWDINHQKCGRGITMFEDEMERFISIASEHMSNERYEMDKRNDEDGRSDKQDVESVAGAADDLSQEDVVLD